MTTESTPDATQHGAPQTAAPPVTMPTGTFETLRDWYLAHIQAFRDAYSNMTAEELDDLPRSADLVDFRAPCQVEVFALSGPIESEVVIITRDTTQQDPIVNVHGPWWGEDFLSGVEEVIRQGRWAVPQRSPFGGPEATPASMLTSYLANVRRTLQSAVLARAQPRSAGGSGHWPLVGLCAHFFGSSLAHDPRSLAKESLDRFRGRRDAGHFRAIVTGPTQKPPSPSRAYAGAHFYPPIKLDEPQPEVSLATKILVDRPPRPERTVAVASCRAGVIIYSDGLVLVESAPAGRETLHRLNVVFASGMIEGLESDAVRQDELHAHQVDPETLFIRSSQGQLSTLRTTIGSAFASPVDNITGYTRPVSKATLRRVLDTAAQLRRNPELATESIFLLQATTFLRSGDFDQAFVLAWLLVERDLARRWSAFLDTRGVNGDRRARLARSVPDRQLETLSLAGELDPTNFDRLMALKGARNAFVHGGQRVREADAVAVMELASAIVRLRASRARLLQLLLAERRTKLRAESLRDRPHD